MTNKKIKEIADFMYSSGTSNIVPFRVSLTFGMSGTELHKRDFIALLKLFRDEEPNKHNFNIFLNNIENDYD